MNLELVSEQAAEDKTAVYEWLAEVLAESVLNRIARERQKDRRLSVDSLFIPATSAEKPTEKHIYTVIARRDHVIVNLFRAQLNARRKPSW